MLCLSLAVPALGQANPENSVPNPPPPTAPPASIVTPLTPPDTSSPRASLANYLSAILTANKLLLEAYREQGQSPGLLSPQSAIHKADEAERFVQRAARSFDFSAVPPSSRRSVTIESVLLLKEILDRVPLPPFDTIPDAAQIAAKAERDRQPPLPSWTVPGTEITLTRVAGDQQPAQYLISKATVDRLEEFYNVLDSRPTRPDAEVDLYDYYSLTPGILLPPKWLGFISGLPDWAQQSYLDEAVWQWIALIVSAVLCIAFVGFVYRRETRPRPGEAASPLAQHVRRLIIPLVIAIVAFGFDYAMEQIINVTGPVLRTVDAATFVIQILAAAWAVLIAANGFVEWILETPTIPSDSLDANLLRAGFRVIGFVGAATVLAHGATNLGIPLFGVIAGLGVGGLAIALAAQPTIENFIGGIILYADRPVRVGDECMFGDMRGIVEEIGIRSTRIRALDRSIITVPNADFAKLRLINLSRRDRMEFLTPLGLRCETTPDQLRYVLDRLREVLRSHPMVRPEPMYVRLTGFAASALTVETKAYVATPNRQVFLAVREELLLRFLEVLEEAGTSLAFPSQTTYLTRDAGLDADRVAAAEETVAAWRVDGRLPPSPAEQKRPPHPAGAQSIPPSDEHDG